MITETMTLKDVLSLVETLPDRNIEDKTKTLVARHLDKLLTRCGFCLTSESSVENRIVTGQEANICKNCVILCAQKLQEAENPAPSEPQEENIPTFTLTEEGLQENDRENRKESQESI